MVSRLKQLGFSLLDLCFPTRCAGCESKWLLQDQGFWCETCLQELPWIGSPLCPRCGCPFPNSPTAENHLCGDCHSSVHPFDSARSATEHTGVVRDRVHQLKFGGRLHWVPPLVELLTRVFQQEFAEPVHLVLPVPLHRKRLRQRGFNQAGLMAKALGRCLQVSVRFDVLLRKHWTAPQTRLNREERLQNVKDAFEVAEPAEVEGRTVLLLDDVFTTGTTLGECTQVLRQSGAARIHALTVTRALPGGKTDARDP